MKAFKVICLFLFNTAFIQGQKINLSSFEETRQQDVKALAAILVESENFMTSCNRCISTLQLLKRIAYLPESFFVSTATTMCNQLKKLDTEVVSLSHLFIISVLMLNLV